MSDQCAANARTALQRAMDTFQFEIDMLTKGGIIEVAVRNPSVAEYMNHWEGRALKAEAALSTLKPEGEKISGTREAIGEAIYRAMYQHEGGRWESNETQDVWFKIADRFRKFYVPTSEGITETMVERAYEAFLRSSTTEREAVRDALEAALGGRHE